MTPNPKPDPRCRHCAEPLPLDAAGKKLYPGRLCRRCKYAAVKKMVKKLWSPDDTKRKPIKRRTLSAATRARRYATAAAKFLGEHPACAACPVLYQDVPIRRATSFATEIHHTRGRLGPLLLDQRFWLPVCAPCHNWIHSHPAAARLIPARGFPLRLICAAGDWNRAANAKGDSQSPD